MTLSEIFDILLAWTPYMAKGFVMNLQISGLAILIGTTVGLAIGLLRLMQSRFIALGARGATALCRNVPSFVMMFYLAVMLPQEIALPGGGCSLSIRGSRPPLLWPFPWQGFCLTRSWAPKFPGVACSDPRFALHRRNTR